MSKSDIQLSSGSHTDTSKSRLNHSCHCSREASSFVKLSLSADCGHLPLCILGSWACVPQQGLAPAPLQVTIREPLLPGPPFTWRKTCLGHGVAKQHCPWNLDATRWPACAGGESSQHQQLALIKCLGLHPGFSELCKEPSRWVTFGLEHSAFVGYLWEGEQGVSCFQENKHCVHELPRVRGSSWLMCWLPHLMS